MAIFTGAGVAIVTPMKENLEINYDKLDEMLEEQIAGGTDAIIICGTTGESATMTEEEHSEAIRFTVERVKHRVPVIAGTGSNSTATAVQLSKGAMEDGACFRMYDSGGTFWGVYQYQEEKRRLKPWKMFPDSAVRSREKGE